MDRVGEILNKIFKPVIFAGIRQTSNLVKSQQSRQTFILFKIWKEKYFTGNDT